MKPAPALERCRGLIRRPATPGLPLNVDQCPYRRLAGSDLCDVHVRLEEAGARVSRFVEISAVSPAQLPKEELAKERGRAVAAAKNDLILVECRRIVRELLERDPQVDVDKVRAELVARRIVFKPGNWMGSIFVGLGLRIVGYRNCSHKRGHARKVAVWARALARQEAS